MNKVRLSTALAVAMLASEAAARVGSAATRSRCMPNLSVVEQAVEQALYFLTHAQPVPP